MTDDADESIGSIVKAKEPYSGRKTGYGGAVTSPFGLEYQRVSRMKTKRPLARQLPPDLPAAGARKSVYPGYPYSSAEEGMNGGVDPRADGAQDTIFRYAPSPRRNTAQYNTLPDDPNLSRSFLGNTLVKHIYAAPRFPVQTKLVSSSEEYGIYSEGKRDPDSGSVRSQNIGGFMPSTMLWEKRPPPGRPYPTVF
jgi:hypothetical protein